MKNFFKMSFFLSLFFMSNACASSNTFYDSKKAHHRPDGFVNSNGQSGDGDKNFLSVMWRFASGEFSAKPPEQGYAKFEEESLTKPDFTAAEKTGQPTLTWLGHSGVLLQVKGLNIIFDPIFSDRASPISLFGAKRKVKSAVQVTDLPPIDAILISHNHYDHLDKLTIRQLRKHSNDPEKFCAYVPLGMGKWFRQQDYKCVFELDWWDQKSLTGEISVTATPVHHWSRRSAFDKNKVLWAGFLIDVKGPTSWKFIHLGDTGYSEDFKEIGKRFGPIDFAAIPIGAYEPRDFMGSAHVAPHEAVTIMKDINAKRAFGIHWGSFELAKESIDQPPRDLNIAVEKAKLPPEAFFVLKQGQTIPVPLIKN